MEQTPTVVNVAVASEAMESTRGRRLRAEREKHFGSAAAFAKAIGVPVSTYNAHERAEEGGRDYKPKTAQKYARRLQVSAEWLLTGRGSDIAEQPQDDAPHVVRVVGYVGAGSAVHFYEVEQENLDEVQAPEGVGVTTVAVEIKGDSLGSMFDRWLVFYDDLRVPVTDDMIGKLCVVGLADGCVLIKKLVPTGDGLFRLLAERGPPIEDAAVSWAAKIKSMAPR